MWRTLALAPTGYRKGVGSQPTDAFGHVHSARAFDSGIRPEVRKEKTLSAFKRGRRLKIDAAQGRKAQDIGAWLAIVLGRGSKPVYFALPRERTHSRSESLLVVLLCGGLALALSFLFRGGSVKPAAPAIFLLIVISIAHFWGRLVSLFVAVAGGLVFATFLFEPCVSLAVCNSADLIVLLLFALSAIAAACLSSNSDTRPK